MSTWLVVGADRGIAAHMCEQLATRGESVVAACLHDSPALRARGIAVEANVDVTADAAVAAMATRLRERGVKIDVLAHLAGVLGLDELGKIDINDVRRQLEINTVGPLRVVQAMLPLLAPNAKVGIVTSRVGSLSDNGSGGMYAYRISKAGANMLALNLHHDLSKRGIAVMALHPGMVDTDLTKNLPGREKIQFIQPEQAAAGLIRRLDELTLATSGEFRHASGEKLTW